MKFKPGDTVKYNKVLGHSYVSVTHRLIDGELGIVKGYTGPYLELSMLIDNSHCGGLRDIFFELVSEIKDTFWEE